MGTGWQFDGVTPERFLALMKKLRDAVGPDFRLAVDGNARLNLEEALKVAKGLNDLGFFNEVMGRPSGVEDHEQALARAAWAQTKTATFATAQNLGKAHTIDRQQ